MLLAEKILHEIRRKGHRIAQRNGRAGLFLFEFFTFGVKQAWACLFGALLLLLILATHFLYPASAVLPRYDFLFLSAVAIQLALFITGLETRKELYVISLFHLVGTVMEIFKTQMGSWEYPDDNWIRLADVPLFSGFMYASVGSYIARAWRLFDLEFNRFPANWLLFSLATLIYINFFTHHFWIDLRWLLLAVSFVIFGPIMVTFRIDQDRRKMPLLLGLILIAFFIWIAENLATFGLIWTYPHQTNGWAVVPFSKAISWYLLMIIGFALVALLYRQRRNI